MGEGGARPSTPEFSKLSINSSSKRAGEGGGGRPDESLARARSEHICEQRAQIASGKF